MRPFARKPQQYRAVRVQHKILAATGVDNSDGGTFTLIEALQQSIPFVTDSNLLAAGIVYEGPLRRTVGREAYLSDAAQWMQNMPERLEGWEVRNVQAYQLKPGQCTCKWTCRFIAPLPPPAQVPGRLPADLKILPGGKVLVEVGMVSEMEVDSEGRISSQRDRFSEGGGGYMYSSSNAAGTVARFEWMMARRLQGELEALHYWRVLREQTRNEAVETAAIQGVNWDETRFESGFRDMLFRQLALGGVLGAVLFYSIKFFKLYMLAQQQLGREDVF
eukprot:CAMPEP_0198200976 /NCGR_PEP_ID=MMETSP1445-20131203/3830_1 /TAXON_ID=36898 /ORGANISM="Pyramimonas sp., Strain CCMP2087" /LENGTH=275 /DNA_ID=CAMNT_0043871149 /DNA_START=358 /DNA_END=1185 /DNA_ORIENTATION=+